MFQSCSNLEQTDPHRNREPQCPKVPRSPLKAPRRASERFRRLRDGNATRGSHRGLQKDEGVFNLLCEGKLPSRPLSIAERMTIAVCHARPTGSITFDSRDLDSKQSRNRFSRLIKRLIRSRRGRKLGYLAFPACSNGHSGWHIHLLVWDYIDSRPLTRHANELGFGRPQIDYIDDLSDLNYFRKVAYHFRQTEEAFGRTHGNRHEKRPKGARRYLMPLPKTLQQVNPKLLSAVDMAKDKSVSDLELLRACPLFSKGQTNTQGQFEQGGSSPSSQASSYITKPRGQGDQHKANKGFQRLPIRMRQGFPRIHQGRSSLLNRRWIKAIQRLGLGRAGPSGKAFPGASRLAEKPAQSTSQVDSPKRGPEFS
jgi:hypothetical protein